MLFKVASAIPNQKPGVMNTLAGKMAAVFRSKEALFTFWGGRGGAGRFRSLLKAAAVHWQAHKF